MTQRTLNWLAATAACICLAAAAGRAQQERVYTSVDVPGAAVTNAQGINSNGDIVGWYTDSTGTHGFVFSGGQFTPVTVDGAVYTDARGINARGDIVGAYRMPLEPAVNVHGYHRTNDGGMEHVDFPGHTNTIPQRITANNRLIVGCRHDADTMDSMRGVTINGRDTTEATDISAYASMNNGATPDGDLIVGLFTDMQMGKGRGFLLYAGEPPMPFDVPGSTFTAGWDVNADGAVVGVFRNAKGFHGFLWEDLRFTSIDFPGAIATRAFGINNRGDIVGAYVDTAGKTHGFVAVRPRADE